MAVERLRDGETGLLIVDVQEKLTPAVLEPTFLVSQIGKLIDGAQVLGLPIAATEQYPAGLGSTMPALALRLEGIERHEKRAFSSCIEPVRGELERMDVRSVLIAGIEAHVCVMQTAFDLLEAGYQPAVVCDAIDSRRSEDKAVAIDRMRQAGVLPVTVESALMEVLSEARGERFKALLSVIK